VGLAAFKQLVPFFACELGDVRLEARDLLIALAAPPQLEEPEQDHDQKVEETEDDGYVDLSKSSRQEAESS
jgi:hypothetical protein